MWNIILEYKNYEGKAGLLSYGGDRRCGTARRLKEHLDLLQEEKERHRKKKEPLGNGISFLSQRIRQL